VADSHFMTAIDAARDKQADHIDAGDHQTANTRLSSESNASACRRSPIGDNPQPASATFLHGLGSALISGQIRLGRPDENPVLQSPDHL